MQVNMLEAKTNLSKLIQVLEKKEAEEITIARNGNPVAKITLIDQKGENKRLNVAKGRYEVPEDFDWCNEEIIEMFEGRPYEDFA